MSKVLLVRPGKSILRILSKLDIIWRISINKVGRFEHDILKMARCELPWSKGVTVFMKVRSIVDTLVASKRNIELPTTIESTETVIAGSV